MSVSLALIPVALTLRLVMGKEHFNKWVESMQVKEPSRFKNELELVRTVRKAGYDADKWGNNIKTHIDGKNLFFFWERVDGQWVAIFGKSDSRQRIERFMADINRAAGRAIFGEESLGVRATQSQTAVASAVAAVPVVPVAPPPIFPTNFVDGDLLFRTLKEFGINPVRQGSDISCKVEQSVLIFRQTGEGNPYQVEIRNAPDLKQVFEYLSDVDEDYRRCVQNAVYEKLKQRAARQNMTIENEEVLEDNSIVVTLNIGS